MRIKVAILENDVSYLNRIASVFGAKYADKLEIYSFTEPDVAIGNLDSARIDLLLADDDFLLDTAAMPRRCELVYLVDSPDIDTANGQKTICKFQKADLIYKQILSIYAEHASNISCLRTGEETARIVAFSSPCGGVGTSSMAVAFARRLAAKKNRALYLNLERFGSSDLYFCAEGQFDMSDLIFALKSRKTNLAMKLESCVKRDLSGVYFFSAPKLALDMLEMSPEDILRLLSEFQLSGSYDYIILDLDFSADQKYLDIFRQANLWMWVSDGTKTSNGKTAAAYASLATMEQHRDAPLNERICLVYNRFNSRRGETFGGEIRELGGAPRIEHSSEEQVIGELQKLEMLDLILQELG